MVPARIKKAREYGLKDIAAENQERPPTQHNNGGPGGRQTDAPPHHRPHSHSRRRALTEFHGLPAEEFLDRVASLKPGELDGVGQPVAQ